MTIGQLGEGLTARSTADVNAFFETNNINTILDEDAGNQADELMEQLKLEADGVLKTQKQEKKVRKRQKMKERTKKVTAIGNKVPLPRRNKSQQNTMNRMNTTNTTANTSTTQIGGVGGVGGEEGAVIAGGDSIRDIKPEYKRDASNNMSVDKQGLGQDTGRSQESAEDGNKPPLTSQPSVSVKPSINFTKKPDKVMEQCTFNCNGTNSKS